MAVLTQEISVVVTVQIWTGPQKLAKPSRPRGEKHSADELQFKELVKEVYGEHPGNYAEGEWTETASNMMQTQNGWLSKHKEMVKLTEKVMGSADYLHNGCVLICPFVGDKCKGAKHRLNGVGRVSQLYSHWQHCHKNNPAARVLEKRWRTVLQARTITLEKLNGKPGHALELSNSWMEAQGGMEQGYEQLLCLSEHTADGDIWRCEPCEP